VCASYCSGIFICEHELLVVSSRSHCSSIHAWHSLFTVYLCYLTLYDPCPLWSLCRYIIHSLLLSLLLLTHSNLHMRCVFSILCMILYRTYVSFFLWRHTPLCILYSFVWCICIYQYLCTHTCVLLVMYERCVSCIDIIYIYVCFSFMYRYHLYLCMLLLHV
jgi:hypothetical protein